MQNNIPTLYILELDSFVVKSAKMSTILCLFVQKIKNVDRIAMVTVTTDYIFNQMSHFMLSQGKFVFAIFACGHEFLASDDASCAYQKHGGRSRQLASRHQLVTDSDLLRIDFGRKMLKCDQN